MKPNRIVFDLDGTLIDSVQDIHGIANALLAEIGHAPITLAEARSYVGNGAGVFVQKMRAARDIPEVEQERLLENFVDKYESAVTLTTPYPGVTDALEVLHSHHSLGICTNKPIRPCHAVLDHLNLSRFFGTVVGGDSLPVRKPDPAMLHATFDAMPDGPPIFVGDSEIDAETARRAKVPFLLYSSGYRKSPVDHIPCDAAFDLFSELPVLIAGIYST